MNKRILALSLCNDAHNSHSVCEFASTVYGHCYYYMSSYLDLKEYRSKGR